MQISFSVCTIFLIFLFPLDITFFICDNFHDCKTPTAKGEIMRTAKTLVLLFFIICCAALGACSFDSGYVVAPEKYLVCLDPGHGLQDVGAKLGERYEKDDVLRLALAVRDILTERGIRVLMTREDDAYPSLEERCELANRAGATVYVSIHRNSGGAKGVEVWARAEKPADDVRLAKKIHSALTDKPITADRGVKYGTAANPLSDYAVNRGTSMPSCIVEVGFIDSEEDNEYFDLYFDDYAAAITEGILDYAEIEY